MRRFLPLILLAFLSTSLFAQTRANSYIDVVFRFDGEPIEGIILSYEYGKRVVLEKGDGSVKEIPWKEVKRVNFRYDRTRKPAIRINEAEESETIAEAEESALPVPERKFRHQVTTALTFGRTINTQNGFSQPITTLGGSVAYHLLRDFSFFTTGAGLDVSLMNHQRRENVLALTGLLEVPVGRGRWRPFARLEAGPSLLFGGDTQTGEEITSRSLSILYHPALGVEITPRNKGWGKLTLDIGYRFLNSRFELTTSTLDVVERNVRYRKFTLRGGMRF